MCYIFRFDKYNMIEGDFLIVLNLDVPSNFAVDFAMFPYHRASKAISRNAALKN